jgi:two-component system response regulator PilR (NtrC family)
VSSANTYRVLVVDDDASVLITYQLILERQGYEVTSCGTSRDAIAAVERRSFDAILCDYSLEEQHTGFEVIAAARKRNPKVPAVLLTGYATTETADEAAAQNIGIMYKPIEIEEFLATTSKMLGRDDEPNQENDKENSSTSSQGDGQGRQQSSGSGARQRSAGGRGKS